MNNVPALDEIRSIAWDVERLALRKEAGLLTEEESADLDRKFEELVEMASDFTNAKLDAMIARVEETHRILEKANDELQKFLESGKQTSH